MANQKGTRTCPTCKGKGTVKVVIFVSKSETNRPLAIKLRNEGHTIREIAGMLGYKNPGSVTNLLEGPKKRKNSKVDL